MGELNGFGRQSAAKLAERFNVPARWMVEKMELLLKADLICESADQPADTAEEHLLFEPCHRS